MNRVNELIKEYCPDGVPFQKVKDVYTRVKGTPITAGKMKEIACDDGEIRIFAGGKTIIDAHEKDIPKANITRVPAVLVQSRGVIDVVYYDKPFTFKNEMWAYTSEDIVSVKFLYYVLKNSIQTFRDAASGMGSLPQISLKVTEEFMLPVPPLEVQREIVHILDSFTLLTAELTAELTARKKQYEFYRNKLLTFDNSVKIVPLADIADIGTGSSNTNEGLEEGKYPFYVRSQEPLRKNEYEYDETAIITAGDGVGVGKVFHYVEGKYALHQRAYRIHINTPDVLPRYYFHYMRSAFLPYIQKTMFQGSVASIRRPMLNQFPVPVPTLDVQKRLVNVLDNFEAICTDLNIGLPAEIEARQKQYEYYRDLLLTFAETGSTLMTDRQTDRQTELSAIKLIQYVFGYAMLPLGKVANVFRGEYITKKNTKEGTIPVILGGQEPAYYIDKYNHDGEIVVIARSGASAGFVSYWNQKIFVTDGFGYEEKSELIATKFLYYVLKNMESELNAMKRGAGVPHVSGEMLNSIELPIPSLQDQQRIVEILDRFDTLCNDLSSGLPAEIEARQKQYEYYRDKLLSFKELPK